MHIPSPWPVARIISSMWLICSDVRFGIQSFHDPLASFALEALMSKNDLAASVEVAGS